MHGAAKIKSITPAGLTALRVLLLLIVTLFLPQTRVWGFENSERTAPGVFAAATPVATWENGDGWRYDVPDCSVAAKGAPRVRLNVFGEGEAKGFLDVSTNATYANGRPLTSGLASGSADDIFIRSAPVSGENTISEIMRLSKPGTRITILEVAEGGQGAILREAFGDAAEVTLQRTFNSQTYVPGAPLEILKLRVK